MSPSTRLMLVASLMVVATACAKQPIGTQASAPAPSGAAMDRAGDAAGGGPAAGAARTSPGSAVTPAAARGGSATGGGSGPGGAGAFGGARPAPQEFREAPELKDVYFEFDRYAIRPADTKILDANAEWLKARPNHLVLIEGHCDERGTDQYNTALGQQRAAATMNYLVARGVTAGRISVITYGEERPVCREHGEACWARNRRAHFLVKPQ